MRPASTPSQIELPATRERYKVELVGIIGGSGLSRLTTLVVERELTVTTPYGEPSAPLTFGQFDGSPVVFLPRHGAEHTIPPHRVNYRANLWAMKHAGVERVVGMAAVGGITALMAPGVICVPDQIIDYTWGREHTLYAEDLDSVIHVDFTDPYCESLRRELLRAAGAVGVDVHDGGTYAATQGPRLESSAEIVRLERDGCDIVGMTGMPEASLARELGLCYACLALSVNWAAGKSDGPIIMAEIEGHLEHGMGEARKILAEIART